MSKPIYLDYAAATPVDASVLAAMQPYFTESFYNPASVYLAGRHIKQEIGDARSRVAHWLGAKPTEIIFTAGATEANNTAIMGVLSQYEGATMVVSAIEHDSVIALANSDDSQIVAVNEFGQVDPSALAESISDTTVVVSIMYANNEIGTIQNLQQLSDVVKRVRAERLSKGNTRPLLLHTDASQAAQYLDLHVDRLGVDLMTISAGKIYGPKQTGCLYVRSGVVLEPLLRGGGQERGLRSGTENVPGIIGFTAALDLVQKQRKDESKRVQGLASSLLADIEKACPEVALVGHAKVRLANNVCLFAPGVDGERIVMELDEQGIQCSTGSACAALKQDASSHVVQALGYSPEDAASTLRISLGRQTTEADIARAAEAIVTTLHKNMA